MLLNAKNSIKKSKKQQNSNLFAIFAVLSFDFASNKINKKNNANVLKIHVSWRQQH